MTPPADDDSSPGDESLADDDSSADDPQADGTPSTDDSQVDSDSADEGPVAERDSAVSDPRRGQDSPTTDDLQAADTWPDESRGDTQSPSAVTDSPAGSGGAQSVSIDVEEYTTGPRSLSASVQVIWALRALVVVGVLGGIGAAVASRFDVSVQYVAVGVFALAVVALIWVHLRHRIWTYRVREDALYLERGVLTRVNTVVPYVRIQHVDTQRGPLERVLGLSTLVVYTAGSRGADVSVPGLTTEEAADLQGRVKDLAIETEGGDAL